MEIQVNLNVNNPGFVDFVVILSRELPGQLQQVHLSGAFPETDEPLKIFRQQARGAALAILQEFADHWRPHS